MITHIDDSAALTAVKPQDAAIYLRQKGWTPGRKAAEYVDRWEYHHNNGEKVDVCVPLRTDFDDYTALIFDLVRTLSTIEQRPQAEVLSDLTIVSSDVYRFRSMLSTAADGTLPLDVGVDLIQGAREAVVAAAYATTGPRNVINTARARQPNAVANYLQRVRLGQTERGSYTVTIVTPVAAYRDPAPRGMLIDVDPFERQVSLTLAKSLGQMQDIAEDSRGQFSRQTWAAAINDGVSANLCEAVVRMSGAGLEADVDIRVGWSLARQPSGQVRDVFHFSQGSLPTIAEAARFLRGTPAATTNHLVGYVRQLSYAPLGQGEKMVVHTTIDHKPAQVHILLTEKFRETAIRAFDEGLPVSCVGTIVHHGRIPYLENVRDITLVVNPLEVALSE